MEYVTLHSLFYPNSSNIHSFNLLFAGCSWSVDRMWHASHLSMPFVGRVLNSSPKVTSHCCTMYSLTTPTMISIIDWNYHTTYHKPNHIRNHAQKYVKLRLHSAKQLTISSALNIHLKKFRIARIKIAFTNISLPCFILFGNLHFYIYKYRVLQATYIASICDLHGFLSCLSN